MEIFKSILLIAQLVGICLLKNNIMSESIKIVIFVAACLVSYDIFRSGISGIKNKMITEGMALMLPIILTGFYGVVYCVRMILDLHKELINADGLYITTIIGMLVYRLIIVGDEIFAKIRWKSAKRFIKESPKECIKYSDGKGVKIKTDDLVIGDILILRPGDEIVADGVVIKGDAVVYEGICLNKRYCKKTAKDEVYKGGIVCDGAMYVRVTTTGRDTVLGNILKESKRAVAYKKTVLKSMDTANGMALILQIVCGAIVLWVYLFNGETLLGLRQGTLATCIMMPVIFHVVRFFADIYSYNTLKKDICLRGDIKDTLEGAAQVNSFIVDYDDVLTKGDEVVTDVYTDQMEEDKLFRLAAVAVSKAKGLSYRAIKTEGMNTYNLEGFKEYVGKGIDAAINPGRLIVTVGTKEYMVEKKISTFEFAGKASRAKDEGKRVLYVAVNKKVEGLLCLGCVMDDNAKEMINGLKAEGLDSYLCTEDSAQIAAYYAKEFGVAKHQGDMLIRTKLDKLDELEGKGPVMVIANGPENGELLATATVSVATGVNYKNVARGCDCIVKEENKKEICKLIKAGKRYTSFISSMFIVSVVGLLMCTFKLSGVEEILGLKSMTTENTFYNEWGICIAWIVAGLIAALFALLVDMIKKKK